MRKWLLSPAIAGLALAFCGSAAAAVPGPERQQLIRGGTPVQQGELPALAFVAYLVPNGHEIVTCTGTVVAPRLVLTAGHCVDIARVDVETKNFRVSIDAVNWTRAFLSAERVVRTMVAPGYQEGGEADDAALLELETPTEVEPLPLARRGFWSAGTPAEMAGWGRISASRHRPTFILHRAPTAVLGFAECRREFPVAGGLCARQAPPQKTSACYGDSGGPLLAHRPGDGRLVEIAVLHGGESAGCNPRAASTYTSAIRISHWVQARIAEASG
jgi:secreted trypsin-like serine protease